MAVNRNIFKKDKGRVLAEKIKAKLSEKFGEAKIKEVRIRGDEIVITADLTAAQWNGVKTKLQAKGYHADIDFDFT